MTDNVNFLQSYLLSGPDGSRRVDASLVTNWKPEQGTLWVHFDVADDACVAWLVNSSGLKSYAVDALLAGDTRPQANIFDDGLLVTLRGVNTNPGADPEDMVSIRVWIDAHRIISTRRRRLLAVPDISKTLDEGLGPKTPGEFLPVLVERLADRIGIFVDSIEDRMDSAEEDGNSVSISEARSNLANLRRQIASVRRFLAPQRDALDRLNRQSSAWLSEKDIQALRQEADRITRYLEDLDLGRERAIVLQEELLSRIAQEQNSRMYVLSVVAAVFLPLTFVTGLLGMNVGGLPGMESDFGFVASLLVMLGLGSVLLLFFRWKKWL